MALINFDNIPGRQISGFNTEMLNWVTEESSCRNLFELSDDFLQMLDCEELPYLNEELSSEIMEELNQLEKDSVPKSSQKQTDSTINRLKGFLKQHNLSDDLINLPPKILNDYLRYFYSQLRTKDGKFYTPSSLVCFRAAIQRFLNVNRPGVNIISGMEFSQANRMLKSMVMKYKTSGQSKSAEAFPVIQHSDMQKLRVYFDRSTAQIIQQEVVFNLLYYFGLRGRETLPYLSKKSIVIENNSNGKKYLRISHELLSKNAKSSLRSKEFEDLKQAKAYENTVVPSECPVKAWELYTMLIKDSANLFPKPYVNEAKTHSQMTFCKKQVIGKHSIDNLMPHLSAKLHLSQRYTNHCIRVTMVTVLKENGYSNSDIARVTGHKNPLSVERYSRKRRDTEFENMAEALHSGNTSRNVEIQHVSKKANIVTLTSNTTHQCGKEPSVAFHFNGSFTNCKFFFPNNDTKIDSV